MALAPGALTQTQSQDQSKVPFPNQASPLVAGDGTLTPAWFPFLRSLWVRTGSGYVGTGTAVVLRTNPAAPGRVEVVVAATGATLGFLSPTAK